jgi:hypothetical protein
MSRCLCEWPCDCGGPAAVLRADLALALDALADHMRREHQKSCGVAKPLPWAVLTRAERGNWLIKARAVIAERGTDEGEAT